MTSVLPRVRETGEVLMVAEDRELLDSLVAPLIRAGHRIRAVSTGAEALALLPRSRADVILVDVDLPDLARVGAARRLPRRRRPPVLCLTGCDGLERLIPEIGTSVEDYVVKPCRVTEVLARVRVLLRGAGQGEAQGALCHGDLLLDDRVCQAWRGQRELQLTAAEYRTLRCLVIHPEQVLSKEQIARQVGGEPRDANAIEQMISRLRRKVDRDGPAMIHTRRGLGYVLSR
ncbi:response regulator transcription factor [Actinoplanes sp. RD1]|uniref:response regulator transcription factor n=1 Tax=Actinoplanes sp. RD1 TaxID=3064538 RepID=UPI00274085AE|nr:response regulator transcription factor [Actinoplanes sp. RD1]